VWDGQDKSLEGNIARFVTAGGPGHLFVAGPVGKPVAAAVAYHLPLVGTNKSQVLLDDLIVGPQGRGQGLGKALTAHVVAWAKSLGAAHISARVDPGELAGARVFEGAGFAPADHLMQLEL
jgi:GNAT superfamily N-acetyltransferase